MERGTADRPILRSIATEDGQVRPTTCAPRRGRAMAEPRLGIGGPVDFAVLARFHKFQRSDLV